MGWLGQKRGELDDLRAAGQFVGRLEGHGGHGIPKSTKKKERRKLRANVKLTSGDFQHIPTPTPQSRPQELSGRKQQEAAETRWSVTPCRFHLAQDIHGRGGFTWIYNDYQVCNVRASSWL